ncbi:spore coat CotO family protein [Rossellomorea vietnamensis]|uniref:Spore coat CotO family protein n=1 Tax=Rossellomorea vietnamensis TaxID=218284 RepID=A0ACD4CAL0_9BACI|nr:spore coat CotO family protein [Rossellomorea vietnamensis]UXH45704.1 spore coat CotO family protein [Rossellomorea vietnamensis]WQI97084.1 spore coat CotO family protein [Rossellomorea vietnamensis]
MRKEKKAGREPLLYINQPRLEEVKGNMQVTYRSVKKPKSKEESNKSKRTPELETSLKSLNQGIQEDKYVDEQLFLDQGEPQEEPSVQPVPQLPERKTAASSFRKLKPFRELNIEEKLDYISASISGKVPFPCEFSNGVLAVKGVILEDSGNEITVKSFQGEEVKMRKNELQSIKMIGLQ